MVIIINVYKISIFYDSMPCARKFFIKIFILNIKKIPKFDIPALKFFTYTPFLIIELFKGWATRTIRKLLFIEIIILNFFTLF